MSDINRLLSENSELREKIVQLESEIDFLKTHPAIAQGIKGETLVCDIVGGLMTAWASGHDVTTDNGAKIEVKFSKIQTPNKKFPTFHRWNWSRPMGWGNYKMEKDYNFLLLIGDKDPYFLSQYPADGSPYVFFLIPFWNVSETLSKACVGGSQAQLNTNLKAARSRRSRAIKKHMVSLTQISDIVGLQIKRGDDGDPEVLWRDVGSAQLVFHGLFKGGTP